MGHSLRYARPLGYLVILTAIACGGCGLTYPDGDFAGKRILLRDTPQYADQLDDMAIGPKQAAQIAGFPSAARPEFIVDGYFGGVLLSKGSPLEVPLTGEYVNGDTGKSKYVHSSYKIVYGFFGPSLQKDPDTKPDQSSTTKP